MMKKTKKLVLGKQEVKFLRAKDGKKVRAVMKVVLKNQKLKVRLNFTDPSLGVKRVGGFSSGKIPSRKPTSFWRVGE